MGQALYRKYRSKSLREIVGQEHITVTLGKALKTGRISHAYLLTGPRGVGKTSIARILAHEINNVPYDETQTHIDIIEIDAASNRRIDEIRDLRDKVFIAPASAKYKVYIIDEVHMLTKEAFNALLKTLEEPPAHVVFILATTEAHKVPETIISRTQRFIFRPIEPAKAVAHLKAIASSEHISISDDALELLAQHADGSFRDSISLLDQAGSHGGKVDIAQVQQMLGIPPVEAVRELLTTLERANDLKLALSQLASLYDHGFQANAIAQQLAQLVRDRAVNGELALPAATALLTTLLEVSVSQQPERFLEIALLDIMASKQPVVVPTAAVAKPAAPVAAPKSVASKAESVSKTTLETTLETTPEIASKPLQQPPKPIPSEKTIPKQSQTTIDKDAEAIWHQVLDILKKKHNTLYGVVRMAKPIISDEAVELTFAFAFHQKRAMESKNLQAIKAAFSEASGRDVAVSCRHDPDLKLASSAAQPQAIKTAAQQPASAPPVAISNIFGDAEVLE